MSHSDRILELIDQYVKPGNHLLTAERIHRHVFEEEIEFGRWEQVRNEYKSRDWDADLVQKYAQQAKQIVEDSTGSIPESYFVILEPDQISADLMESELERVEYEPEAEGEDKEGFEFKYDESENLFNGRYVYVDVDTTVTYGGDLKQLVTEGAIEFRIDPEEELLIIKSTKVTDIQKAKSIFSKKTNLELQVLGDLTKYSDTEIAVDKVDSFRSSFKNNRQEVSDGEPALLEVQNIQITDPTVEEEERQKQIEDINFEGQNIGDHDEIREYTDDGWIIKGLEAPIFYGNDLYELKMSGNEMMGYVRINNVKDYQKGRELVEILREKYREHIVG